MTSTTKPMFICRWCRFAFAHTVDLLAHVQQEHGVVLGDQVGAEPPAWVCNDDGHEWALDEHEHETGGHVASEPCDCCIHCGVFFCEGAGL